MSERALEIYTWGQFSRGLTTPVEARKTLQAKSKELLDQVVGGKSSNVNFFKVKGKLPKKKEESISFQAIRTKLNF